MKRKLWTLLLALGAALALCAGASAQTVETNFYEALHVTNGSIKLENDFFYENVMEVDNNLTIDLNGYVLTIPKSICVNSGAHLTIKDSGTTAEHKFTPDANGLWVLDEANGTETVCGGVITGGTGYQYQKTHPTGEGYTVEAGGGVCVKVGGKLTMEGGNIVGCTTAHGYGGGVYVEGNFSMTGGSIIGCAANRGGGVYMAVGDNESAAFSMSGNAIIRCCKAVSSDASGGGVYALGKFTMSDNAAIRDCECSSNSGSAMGGGVCVAYHTKNTEFTMGGNAVIENCNVTTASQNSWIKSYGGGVYVGSRASLTLKDQAAIRKCSAKNTSGGATHGGGIFARGTLAIAGCAEVGENCTAGIGSGIYLEVPSYSSASENLYANGGVIAGEVVLNNSSNYGGTIKITGSNEGVTEFKGSVLNNGGTIEKGKFTGEVTNNGTISGGEFIGTVINGEDGTIAGDVSIPNLNFIVTFVNEGTKTTKTIAKDAKLTAPAAPTKEGYRFGGWYYGNSGSEAKWDFDTDTVTRAMTLTAKWVQTYTVTFDTNGGSAVDPVTVDAGSTVSKPADPARSGYAFDGWYTENTYENPYDFHAAVTGSLTLYAKWNSIVYSDPTYAVSAPTAENGKIAVSPKNASAGSAVTITVKPDSGYVLETISVTDKNGNDLKLTDKGNGKYTFTMPASKVEIKATFMEDNSVLNFFYDVPNDAYYFEAVKWAAENGITGGIGNGLFGPNQPCTRGQIVTFLWRAAGSPEPKSMSSFSDVSADSYYAKAVAWAVENGITTGTGDGKFSPDATCTRAQSVTFLFRAIGKLVDSKAEFSDVLTDSYYANAVAWAVENGVTNGIGDGLFGPDNSCTRAQIVTFLFRAYQGK